MKRTAAVVATAFISVFLPGCSPSEVVNTGGDTKCKDFIAQDEKKQNEELAKMLKDKSGVEPSGLELSATHVSVSTYCRTVGKPDSKISEAPHG